MTKAYHSYAYRADDPRKPNNSSTAQISDLPVCQMWGLVLPRTLNNTSICIARAMRSNELSPSHSKIYNAPMLECCSRSSNVDLAGVAPGRRDGRNLSSRAAKLDPGAWARAGGQGGARLFPLGQLRYGGLRTPP